MNRSIGDLVYMMFAAWEHETVPNWSQLAKLASQIDEVERESRFEIRELRKALESKP